MSIQSTQRRFYKVPPTLRFFMSADSLTAKSSAHLGDSQATGCCCGGPRGNTADCSSFGWQDISSSGLATQTLIKSNDCRFQCTFHRGRHNVHVYKQLAGSVILDIHCTQVWSGEENIVRKCEVERKTCNPV